MIYNPREDSFLLEKAVKKYAKGKSFLDIGAGSGIQAKAAIKMGAKYVLASDINQEAVRNLKKQNISVIKSNLFEKIKERFDIIAFNPPYLPGDKREDGESQLATTGGEKGDEIIIKFLNEAKSHLNKKGIILLLLSSLTPKKRILETLKKQNLSYKIIDSEKFFFESLEVWKIEQSSLKA
ncbi:MAG TPA: HemK2/MTQ2 family protein methyltransferase [Candidatus Nanoarchaeia archaeon]|nr:HemK2/MTQ2 family protein methyltransferase [Candidatus Nanoarchaeia archaeon]